MTTRQLFRAVCDVTGAPDPSPDHRYGLLVRTHPDAPYVIDAWAENLGVIESMAVVVFMHKGGYPGGIVDLDAPVDCCVRALTWEAKTEKLGESPDDYLGRYALISARRELRVG